MSAGVVIPSTRQRWRRPATPAKTAMSLVEPRVHHGLQVALLHEVLADAVGVVEQVPVGDLLARACALATWSEVRELRRARLPAGRPCSSVGANAGRRPRGARGGPPKQRRCPAPYWYVAVEAPLDLDRDLLSEAEAVLQLVVLLLGVAQARANRGGAGPGVSCLPNVKRAEGLPSRASSSGWMSTGVEAEVDELARDRAREAAQQQRRRLLAHDPAAAGQGDVGAAGGDEARDLLRGQGAGSELRSRATFGMLPETTTVTWMSCAGSLMTVVARTLTSGSVVPL